MACMNLQKSNLLMINFGAEFSDFVCCLRVFDNNVLAFVRVFWSSTAGAVQARALVRVPQTYNICGSFIANSIQIVLDQK